jgi:hypothetical protein
MYKVLRNRKSIYTNDSLNACLEHARLTKQFDPLLGIKGHIAIVDKHGKAVYNEGDL